MTLTRPHCPSPPPTPAVRRCAGAPRGGCSHWPATPPRPPTPGPPHALQHGAELTFPEGGAASPERLRRYNSYRYPYLALSFLFILSVMAAYSNLVRQRRGGGAAEG